MGAVPVMIPDDASRRVQFILPTDFTDEATLRILVVGAWGIDDAIDRLTQKVDDLILGSLEADLKTGQMMGILRSVDTSKIARFLSGLQKLLLTELKDGKPIDISEVTRLVVELEVFGLTTPALGPGCSRPQSSRRRDAPPMPHDDPGENAKRKRERGAARRARTHGAVAARIVGITAPAWD